MKPFLETNTGRAMIEALERTFANNLIYFSTMTILAIMILTCNLA